jgi:2-keto-4-pentenoate hydratase/2-oxohepta-3-ene-1,7-dioic acid hydratase in catechol pathway
LRLIGFLFEGEAWIGDLADQALRPIAPLDAFYDAPHKAMQEAPGRGRPALDPSSVTKLPPVPKSARVLCVGLNYRSHAAEAGMEVPAYPTIFGRWASTLVVDGTELWVPPGEAGLDWEVELGVIIGRRLHCADPATALEAVLGYTVFNDVSARRKQMQTSQWTLGKNADRSGPIGPVVLTPDELPDPRNLQLELKVNGVVQQSANTKDMVFPIPEILAYVTETLTLEPGDVVATGTPDGVGFTRSPALLLGPGDVVEAFVEGIGTLRNPVGYRTSD